MAQGRKISYCITSILRDESSYWIFGPLCFLREWWEVDKNRSEGRMASLCDFVGLWLPPLWRQKLDMKRWVAFRWVTGSLSAVAGLWVPRSSLNAEESFGLPQPEYTPASPERDYVLAYSLIRLRCPSSIDFLACILAQRGSNGVAVNAVSRASGYVHLVVALSRSTPTKQI